MGDYKKLFVWRKAHALALNVNRAVGRIRQAQYSSQRSQTIRAALSISTNIVEGSGKKTDKDFVRFLNYSFDSSRELEYHLLVLHDLCLISNSTYRALLDQLVEVEKMLHGLISYLSEASADK